MYSVLVAGGTLEQSTLFGHTRFHYLIAYLTFTVGWGTSTSNKLEAKVKAEVLQITTITINRE